MQDKAEEKIKEIEKEIKNNETKVQFIEKSEWNATSSKEDLSCYIFDLTGASKGRLLVITDDGKTINRQTTLSITGANFAVNAGSYEGIKTMAKTVLQQTQIQ